MTVKLIKKLTYRAKDALSQYKRSHFSAVIFFDFFFKGKKIISLPQTFNIVPWSVDRMTKNSIEDNDIFFPLNYPGIRHYDVKNNYFYLAIAYSFGQNRNDTPRESEYFLLITFLNQFENSRLIKGVLPVLKSQRYTFSFNFVSSSTEKFCDFLEKEIGCFMREEGEKVLNRILSSLEENYGEVKRLESIDDSSCEQLGTQNEIFSYINALNLNYCSQTPSHKTINLEDQFSDEFLFSFLQEIESCGLSCSNPFGGEIEDSVEEYKKYLLTLYGPGKWEYSNLEVEKLDLTIEELVCLNIIVSDMTVSGLLDLSFEEPAFFSTEDYATRFLHQRVPYLYFWYKLKDVVKNQIR